MKTDTDNLDTDHVPSISVIIPCRNEIDCIESCLRSILRQQPPSGGFEVIVADGMSKDGTREILSRLAEEDNRVRVVDNPGRFASSGLNAAIKVARGGIIIRMDAHTEYAADYICECVAVLEETGADNVGGPARTMAESYMQAAICAAYHSRFSVGGARFHNVGYEGYADTVPYGCWRREVFDRIGVFDEALVRNQDDEFNLRLIRAGGKVWQSPNIKSWYKPRGSLKDLFSQYMQYGYWKVRIIQKHGVPASVRHLIPGIFVFLLLVLSTLAPLSAVASYVWLCLVGFYSVANVFWSGVAAAGRSWKILPALPFVFCAYHIGYGYGFLRGIWDFVVLRRAPLGACSSLTRRTVMTLRK
jgi:glycosyltransferase involved in cell wall biosynthesis